MYGKSWGGFNGLQVLTSVLSFYHYLVWRVGFPLLTLHIRAEHGKLPFVSFTLLLGLVNRSILICLTNARSGANLCAFDSLEVNFDKVPVSFRCWIDSDN
jgi:hypothetical protein